MDKRARTHTAVQLSRSKNNHPEVRFMTLPANQVADVQRHGAVEKHRQELEAHDAEVDARPSLVGPGVHHPQLRKGVPAAALGPVDPLALAPQEVVRRGEQACGVGARVGDDVGEEAVVEEAAFEDEVAERVGEMPDEEESEGGGGGRREDGLGRAVCE